MRSLLFLVGGLALTACAMPRVQVSVLPSGPNSLHVSVVEHQRDPSHHRPAIRSFEFTIPKEQLVQTNRIRDYHERYDGADGSGDGWVSPAGGYLIVREPDSPRSVEFRLLEFDDGRNYVFPMSINGIHSIAAPDR